MRAITRRREHVDGLLADLGELLALREHLLLVLKVCVEGRRVFRRLAYQLRVDLRLLSCELPLLGGRRLGAFLGLLLGAVCLAGHDGGFLDRIDLPRDQIFRHVEVGDFTKRDGEQILVESGVLTLALAGLLQRGGLILNQLRQRLLKLEQVVII